MQVTTENFQTEVLECTQTVLLDFWAEWCMPCQMLAPIVAEISDEYPQIKVCKVNVDEEPVLAVSHKIASIPTLMVVKDGKVINQTVGYCSKEEIKELLGLK